MLECYPEGFFDGTRVLTRYEFAQATARLLDRLEIPMLPNVDVIADLVHSKPRRHGFQVEKDARKLRFEFAQVLHELAMQIEAINASTW
jgi:hypothetical protein